MGGVCRERKCGGSLKSNFSSLEPLMTVPTDGTRTGWNFELNLDYNNEKFNVISASSFTKIDVESRTRLTGIRWKQGGEMYAETSENSIMKDFPPANVWHSNICWP